MTHSTILPVLTGLRCIKSRADCDCDTFCSNSIERPAISARVAAHTAISSVLSMPHCSNMCLPIASAFIITAPVKTRSCMSCTKRGWHIPSDVLHAASLASVVKLPNALMNTQTASACDLHCDTNVGDVSTSCTVCFLWFAVCAAFSLIVLIVRMPPRLQSFTSLKRLPALCFAYAREICERCTPRALAAADMLPCVCIAFVTVASSRAPRALRGVCFAVVLLAPDTAPDTGMVRWRKRFRMQTGSMPRTLSFGS